MDTDWVRIAGAFATEAASAVDGALCSVCARLLEVRGAGITILDGVGAGPVCSSDARMRALDDLQFTLGEGPCRDAFDLEESVLVADLDHDAAQRWPMFTLRAQESGVAAVFAFPLRRDTACFGVLALYHDVGGGLSSDQETDALAVSSVITESIVTMVRGESLALALDGAISGRSEVHQATGMVAAQLGVTTAEALARIRGHAFSTGRSVDEVATAVVSRTLRIVDDREEGASDG